MKIVVARTVALGMVASFLIYLTLARCECSRLNREIEDAMRDSDRLDEESLTVHYRICEKANLMEEAVRYGCR